MNERKREVRKRVLGEPKKVVVRLDPIQWERASRIRDKFGFKSIYEISQYLWGCFLRVADPEHEETDDPVPEEIKNMFNRITKTISELRRMQGDCKPRRAASQSEVYEAHGQLSLPFNRKEGKDRHFNNTDLISKDTTETFEYLGQAERHFEYVKPKRSINNASLNDSKFNH